MWKLITTAFMAAALFLTTSAAMADPLSIKEAFTSLDESVLKMEHRGDKVCSASKIGPRSFLTARHCVVDLAAIMPNKERTVRLQRSKTWLTVLPASVEVGMLKGEDWAVFHTYSDTPDIPMLQLGCGEEVELGDRMVTAGYPTIFNKVIVTGLVASVEEIDHYLKDEVGSEFWVDFPSGGGASGSPVISLKTGKITGILVEGVRTPALTGIESVDVLSICVIRKMARDAALENGAVENFLDKDEWENKPFIPEPPQGTIDWT
jgi:hypothetical protein